MDKIKNILEKNLGGDAFGKIKGENLEFHEQILDDWEHLKICYGNEYEAELELREIWTGLTDEDMDLLCEEYVTFKGE